MILQSDSISLLRSSVRRWVTLLAEGRFDEAAAEVNSLAAPCSAATLRDAIGRYSRKYRDASDIEKAKFFPTISSPLSMNDRGENLVLYPKEDSTVVEYDLPIENDWSDLTAKFQLVRRSADHFELSLIDLRVL